MPLFVCAYLIFSDFVCGMWIAPSVGKYSQLAVLPHWHKKHWVGGKALTTSAILSKLWVGEFFWFGMSLRRIDVGAKFMLFVGPGPVCPAFVYFEIQLKYLAIDPSIQHCSCSFAKIFLVGLVMLKKTRFLLFVTFLILRTIYFLVYWCCHRIR